MNNIEASVREEAKQRLRFLERGTEQSYWYANRQKLLNSLINDDLNAFMQWEVIRHTMYVHGTDYVQKEFNDLRFAPDYVQWSVAIKETTVGSPILAPFYPSSSENLIHHAYHVHTFEHTAKKDASRFTSVLEFGGGFGSMCRLFKNLGFTGNYVIFDLPEFVILQKFFLRSLGYVVCDTLKEHRTTPGSIYCTSSLADLEPQYDLFLATWSISETSFDFRKDFLDGIKFNNYLIAYQDDFFGVKNHDYFNPFMQRVPLNWKSWKIEHLYGEQFYMMGWK